MTSHELWSRTMQTLDVVRMVVLCVCYVATASLGSP